MKKKKCIIYIIVLICVVIFCLWQNNDIVTSRYEYAGSNIPEELNGYTIVQVSDLHNKLFGREQAYLLAQIEVEQPDMIVITGDLVDSNHTDIDKAMTFVEGATKLAPVYYVTGNHENWLEESVSIELYTRLRQVGVVSLSNETIQITVDGAAFTLIGLEDANLWDNTLKKMMQEEVVEDFTILLAHEPQYLNKYAEAGVDIVLSGHAHGGQIRLPWIGGLVAPDQGFFPEYTAGLYVERNTSMYVSRGLGNSIIPVRVFNRPELVVISLNSEKFAQ